MFAIALICRFVELLDTAFEELFLLLRYARVCKDNLHVSTGVDAKLFDFWEELLLKQSQCLFGCDNGDEITATCEKYGTAQESEFEK